MRSWKWIACVAVLTGASPAFAYIGPGMGVGVLGVVLGIVASFFLAIFAVLWYPLKRLIRRLGGRTNAGAAADRGAASPLPPHEGGTQAR